MGDEHLSEGQTGFLERVTSDERNTDKCCLNET